MIKLIKRHIPDRIKIKIIKFNQILSNPTFIYLRFKNNIFSKLEETAFFHQLKRMIHIYSIRSKHKVLLKKIEGKNKVKIVFLVTHRSVWKVDSVFRKMLLDPFFEPIILVCPYIQYGRDKMLEELNLACEYFENKKYPLINSYDELKDSWIKIEDLKPDLIFFTNPHNITKPEYYTEIYEKYLSFYIPYYYMATDHAGDKNEIYNSQFILEMFKVFWPSSYHLKCQNEVAGYHIKNGFALGYPASEIFVNDNFKYFNVWKPQKVVKKKIIFAPHHTIEKNDNSLSSFLVLVDFIKKLAIKYSDSVQWSFKPHPILKSKLYIHEDWGVDKTNDYYNFWQMNDFTQLDEGEYESLFYYSDAIIHDSSSFLAEYVFTNKPALYLMNPEKINSLVNDFGKIFISYYIISDKKEVISKFVHDVIEGNVSINKNKELRKYIQQYYADKKPSDLIVDEIKKSLTVSL